MASVPAWGGGGGNEGAHACGPAGPAGPAGAPWAGAWPASAEVAGDAELAMAMQVTELEAHESWQSHLREASRVATGAHRADRLVDPVWGEVEDPSVWQRALFVCFPCAVVGCCGGFRGKRVWRQFFLTWSAVLGAVQVAVLAIIIAVDGVHPQENFLLGPHHHALDAAGAKNAARILRRGEWWRLLAPVFLHAGLLHLLGNLFMQLRTGVMLELLWGHGAWLAVYLWSGAFANLVSCAALPGNLGVGSSGALCGLVGAWLAFTLITWNQTLPLDVGERNQQVLSISFCIVLIIALSFFPLMDFAAHLGGLVGGASLAMALFAGRLQHTGYRVATRTAGVILVIGLTTGVLCWLVFLTEVDDRLLALCGPAEC